MKFQRRRKPILGLWLFLFAFWLSEAVAAVNLPDFTGLVKDSSPAVVNISTTVSASSGRNPNVPFTQDQLEQMPEFFRHFFEAPEGPMGPAQPGPRHSMGSGFIVSPDGYVLTNNHVVDGAEEIIVRLSDRRELEATVVGTDPSTDLAVLKVEGTDLPVVRLGKSAELEVGEWVVAIGSPFGFDHTVTAGIVSAKGRALPSENYVPFIQTDVAINPGNSGGPLFNLDGDVVGINSQIYTRSGGFMGVSFAIPVDVAMNVFEQIRDQGYVSRGWLGVLIQEVSRDLAQSFGLSKPHGALVAEVMPGSPAAKAGLKPGDIILEFEGEEIGLSAELPPQVGRVKVGSTAELLIMRNGNRQEIDVTIGELPNGAAQNQQSEPAKAMPGNPLGLEVEPLPRELKQKWDVEGGVLVTNVGQGPARKAGIRPGDVIRSINNQDITSPDDFRAMLKDLPRGKALPALIVRDGAPSFVVLKLEK
ncbi:DegQ family serine endoprotease [Hydrocarboniclastica marina]|uniref:Probable periplasmic serine endoprotease DegP-like n=1 Tax=Hydrocarboniclastica marina TaxID=2259620 RepID=A0A4P7XGI3_9ALTE|nr:DegQ family serine endoprotease [Hydrocarboniclastica marina]QCF25292.1 DegQ family serine endoprotease [Hydrocarboniclastica marina]